MLPPTHRRLPLRKETIAQNIGDLIETYDERSIFKEH